MKKKNKINEKSDNNKSSIKNEFKTT